MTCSLSKWVVLLIGLWMASPAFAKMGPCQIDIEKYCANIPKGHELAKCLSEHKAELSPSCQGKYLEMKGRMRHAFKVCQEDAEKFCSDLDPAPGPAARALPKCLKSHEAELSKECRDSLGNKKRKRK